MYHRFILLNLECTSDLVAIFVIIRESQVVYTDYLIASLDTIVQKIMNV
jgi:hypothetical protein